VDISAFDYLQFLLALIFVLALIGGVAVLARRLGFGFSAPSRQGKTRRLSLIEAIPVDARRRLLLVRRDDTEHLILLGAASETLIESAITAPSCEIIDTEEDTP
jgi:flagellar protein FliO/FliZ